MNNEQTEQTTTETSRHDSAENFRAELGKIIRAAIRAAQLPPDAIITAPKTIACCRALDSEENTGPTNITGTKTKQLPIEVFTAFDPDAPSYAGLHLQKDMGRIAPFRKETFEMILAAGATQVEDAALILDEEMACAKDIQIKMDQLFAQLQKFAVQSVQPEVFSQRDRRVSETIKNGALPATPVRTRESIAAEFEVNRLALNESLMILTRQAIPIAAQVWSRALKAVRAQMAYMEHGERELAKAYGIPWRPSYLWQSCFVMQTRIHPERLLSAANSPAQPRHLLEGIVEI